MTLTATAVTETPTEAPPGLVHPGWRDRFPWLVQGFTGRGDPERPFDLGLFSAASPAERVLESWEALARATGLRRVAHARQVHGSTVRVHREGPAGLHLGEPCDGHVTATPGLLLAVTTADCVPVTLVDAGRRAVGLLHAGWRGAAAGVLERGFEVMGEAFDTAAPELWVHLGPAICGRCYEVGPEVFRALGQPEPEGPQPIDLRGALVERARTAGVHEARISVSTHCTRCTGSGLFSHRGGDGQRQVGYVGVRP